MKKLPSLTINCLLVAAVTAVLAAAAPAQSLFEKPFDHGMSPMGQLAHRAKTMHRLGKNPVGDEFEGGYEEGPTGGQAETSLAVDSTGKHIVVGFNDTRGFTPAPGQPVSVSGFAYSDDGGLTFHDGGQLPVNTVAVETRNGKLVPQIFGDPEILYLGGSTFVYFSIEVAPYSSSGVAQTMCVHRSTDYGHTWQGPYEITTATNPGGGFNGTDSADDADKEFADVDPDTGRAVMSWSNFTPTGVKICTTICDNLKTGNPPVWKNRNVLNSPDPGFNTGSIPKFAGNGSGNVYVVWSRQPSAYALNTMFARSLDNGVTFQAAKSLRTSDFTFPDQIPGNDRIHSFPWLAVDNSTGPYKGSVYVAYSDNNSKDGADIAFQKSTNGGSTFSGAIYLDRAPGADRSQWFPTMSVDKSTGRLNVMWDDQGVDKTGDRMEMTWVHSDSGGASFSRPQPLTARPFHAGYGNNTGQPNIGDYNQIKSQGGEVFASMAITPESLPFTEGLPATSMTWPDTVVVRSKTDRLAVALGTVTFNDARNTHQLYAGATAAFNFPLLNYTTNSHDSRAAFTNVKATLSTSTPGVTMIVGATDYPNIAYGATSTNTTPLKIRLGSAFVPGTPIDLKLHVTSAQGSTDLLYSQYTGILGTTVLLSENFDGTAAGVLPAGWVSQYVGGDSEVKWVTKANNFGGTTNGAYHPNSNSSVGGSNQAMGYERLLSPIITVPADAGHVTLDFDTAYVTEDDATLKVLAYDGYTVRIVDFDQSTTTATRSVLAEAFARSIQTTGGTSFMHYPKHLPRSSNSNYFQDMSVFAGDSAGMKHVHMILPGIKGRNIQVRFEYTQDLSRTGADRFPGRNDYGVLVDNVIVRSVRYSNPRNSAPVGVDDFYVMQQDSTYSSRSPGALANDTDAEHDALYPTATTQPAHGTVTSRSDGSFTYTPAAGFHGFDTFTYRPFDGSATGNVTTVGIVVKSTEFGFGISPSNVKGGGIVTGRIYLNSPAPAGGTTITLKTATRGITLPASVVVPQGATFAKFTIKTSAVTSVTQATVTSSLHGISNSAVLTVMP